MGSGGDTMGTRHRDLQAFADSLRLDPAAVERAGLIPLRVGHAGIGWLAPAVTEQIRRWPAFFQVEPGGVTLSASLDSNQRRTEALDQVTRALASAGLIRGWRDERIAISDQPGGPELFRLERAAARSFGVLTLAAQPNGFVRGAAGVTLWIARRAPSKDTYPGMLDTLVGGRVAVGLDPAQTLRKEAWEEAGLAPAQVDRSEAGRSIQVEYLVPGGLHRERLFIHDLWLPAGFVPENKDGEVSEFRRLPVGEVLTAILGGDFTPEAGAVTLSGLISQGLLPADAFTTRAADNIL